MYCCVQYASYTSIRFYAYASRSNTPSSNLENWTAGGKKASTIHWPCTILNSLVAHNCQDDASTTHIYVLATDVLVFVDLNPGPQQETSPVLIGPGAKTRHVSFQKNKTAVILL